MTIPNKERISLYVHVPFCETKCPYCDFNTYARIESLMPSYIEALEREIRAWGQLFSRPAVHTVFLGGGTPSYLPAEDIDTIMSAVREAFEIEGGADEGQMGERLGEVAQGFSIGACLFSVKP